MTVSGHHALSCVSSETFLTFQAPCLGCVGADFAKSRGNGCPHHHPTSSATSQEASETLFAPRPVQQQSQGWCLVVLIGLAWVTSLLL